MTRAATPTALIADDESLLREDLRDKLAALWPELRLVAEAGNGNEAAALIAGHAPDIAFLDIKMPGLSGIEVAQGIEMGRPSRLSIEAEKTQGTIAAVRVGGASVIMCEGTLTLRG